MGLTIPFLGFTWRVHLTGQCPLLSRYDHSHLEGVCPRIGICRSQACKRIVRLNRHHRRPRIAGRLGSQWDPHSEKALGPDPEFVAASLLANRANPQPSPQATNRRQAWFPRGHVSRRSLPGNPQGLAWPKARLYRLRSRYLSGAGAWPPHWPMISARRLSTFLNPSMLKAQSLARPWLGVFKAA